ncbi:MAG TPA: tetratricopeptide repeat protein [Candidatus Methylomirabilis sp.]|nr:tetratricopeptide repeat protein [Candidatus Methylomirabilis sp.]
MSKQSGRKAKPASASVSKRSKTGPPLPVNSEAALQRIQKLLQAKTFKDVAEANAFLATLTGTSLEDLRDDGPDDPRWRAQELAFDAMEADTAEKARELAQQALGIDADCVDALVVMTNLDANTTREAISGLKQAVEAGERALGEAFFRENKGEFWGIIETRPYMRAKAQLAELLRSDGKGVQAMHQYEGLLELNPNDNQGVRYPLLGCYLAHGRLQAAAKLLHDYDGDIMAVYPWGRVLERFLSGDRPGATKALKQARRVNRFVELYFSGLAPVPTEMPDTYALGSEEEAIVCFDCLATAWTKHLPAMFWLMDRLHGGAPPRTKRR